MRALTTNWIADFESRMRFISEREYDSLLDNLWYTRVTRITPGSSQREVINWLLSTAAIEYKGKRGGNTHFDNLVMRKFEYEHKHAGASLKLHQDQLTDSDGNGLQLGAAWSADMGRYMAYWPQKQTATALKVGHAATSLAYDGIPFFSTSHPLNPYNTGAGVYSNLYTGGNALPIDSSVTVDVALNNMATAMSNIRSIKMPNGEDPRNLRPVGILCGPKLGPRVAQLTNAKFIAQAAAGGAGSADVEALIQTLGYAPPVIADELAGFESDTTWFILTQSVTDSEMGGLIYSELKPFGINFYGPGSSEVESILRRSHEFEWNVDGRNTLVYGHPYSIIKVMAA